MGFLSRKKRRNARAQVSAPSEKFLDFESIEALKLAVDADLLESDLVGTGKDGVITIDDVHKAIAVAKQSEELNHIPPVEEVERPDAASAEAKAVEQVEEIPATTEATAEDVNAAKRVEEPPATYEDMTPPKKKTKKDILPQ